MPDLFDPPSHVPPAMHVPIRERFAGTVVGDAIARGDAIVANRLKSGRASVDKEVAASAAKEE